MQADRFPSENTFLTITDEAVRAINNLAATKPQGAFRITAVPTHAETKIEFAWDDVFTQDDYLIPVPNSTHDIVMDALSIAYILDEYTLSHDNYRFILSKNKQGPLRHQRTAGPA